MASTKEYSHVPSNDSELDSEEEIAVRDSYQWHHDLQRKKPRTLLQTLWLCFKILFTVVSVAAWMCSLWLVYLSAQELETARSIFQKPIYIEKPSSHECEVSSKAHKEPPTSDHSTPKPPFIPGGTLPVPGYGMVYNTSYCNGWDDPEGAISRGCVLDSSQGGWVHELCHDKYLLAEWLKLPDFGWWQYPNRTGRIPQEKVWAADIPGGVNTQIYTVKDFHVQHCRFVMRLRSKNGMRKNRGLGYIPLDPSHMNHCVDMMIELNTPEAKSELTEVTLGGFGGGTEGFGLGGECYVPLM